MITKQSPRLFVVVDQNFSDLFLRDFRFCNWAFWVKDKIFEKMSVVFFNVFVVIQHCLKNFFGGKVPMKIGAAETEAKMLLYSQQHFLIKNKYGVKKA